MIPLAPSYALPPPAAAALSLVFRTYYIITRPFAGTIEPHDCGHPSRKSEK
jgi:hypothetical protein